MPSMIATRSTTMSEVTFGELEFNDGRLVVKQRNGDIGDVASEDGQSTSKIVSLRIDRTTFTVTTGTFDDRNPSWGTLT